MGLILTFLVMTAVMVIPVKMAASIVGAKNTGFFSCFWAIVVAGIIQLIAARLIPGLSEQLGILLSLPLVAIAYMMVLETSFIKGILIAILQGILLFVLMFLFAGLLVI